jgi:hypothetical protein
MMATGTWDLRPKQLEYPFGSSSNRTHLIICCSRDINQLFYELGYSNTRRAYRMKRQIFWNLCSLLRLQLEPEYDDPLSINRIPNGRIDHTVCISIALRYLAGGQAMDIALEHGVSHSTVFESLWLVVDVINQQPELSINFPECHVEQLQLANDFRNKSMAGLNSCIGAVDGMLIWIHQPSKQHVQLTKCGKGKFFCGQKFFLFKYAGRM